MVVQGSRESGGRVGRLIIGKEPDSSLKHWTGAKKRGDLRNAGLFCVEAGAAAGVCTR